VAITAHERSAPARLSARRGEPPAQVARSLVRHGACVDPVNVGLVEHRHHAMAPGDELPSQSIDSAVWLSLQPRGEVSPQDGDLEIG
jgi:hypothetical protein